MKNEEFLVSFSAVGADSFNYIFGFFGLEAFGECYRRDAHVGETNRLMTDTAGEMNMSHAVARVIDVAHTVFLRARTIINVVQKMCLTQ